VLVCDVRVLFVFTSVFTLLVISKKKIPFQKRRGGKTGFFLASFFFREREIPRERRLEIFFVLSLLLTLLRRPLPQKNAPKKQNSLSFDLSLFSKKAFFPGAKKKKNDTEK